MIKDINIGFIGLGNVGSKLANSLMQGGYNLFVYDLEKMKANVLTSKGAFWCDNIESLVKKTSVIIEPLPQLLLSYCCYVNSAKSLSSYLPKIKIPQVFLT